MKEYQILEIRDELLKNRVVFEDLHGGNMGQRADGTWVAFDLGSESISPGAEPPLLEGGPIDRMTGPTDFSGKPRIDGDVELEAIIREQFQRLFETQNPNSTIGVTIGRFQPFHAGHAAIIRQLSKQFSNVVVFIAGQKQDKKNPFSHELRLRMMELSLPDVWSKIKVFPATIQGKGSGYIPSLVANAAASKEASIPQDGAITVLVGEDRLQDYKTQVLHNAQHQGEPGYYTGVIDVQVLPGVKNDDDAGRISGTRVREAIAINKSEEVKKMLDPHLSQSGDFEAVYVQMRDEMKRSGLVREIIESIINELGMGAADGGPGATRGGGTSGWSRAILARDMTGDEIYNQLLRSPSTRMLPLTNHGTPNDHLPGQDVLDQRDDDEQDHNQPTDLSDAVVKVINTVLEKVGRKRIMLDGVPLHPWTPGNDVPWSHKNAIDQFTAGKAPDPSNPAMKLPGRAQIAAAAPVQDDGSFPPKVYRKKSPEDGRALNRLNRQIDNYNKNNPQDKKPRVQWPVKQPTQKQEKEVSARMKGNGEAKFAWEKCRELVQPYNPNLGGEPGDVEVGGQMWEVKELDATKASSGFRIEGPSQEYIADFVDNLRALGKIIMKAAQFPEFHKYATHTEPQAKTPLCNQIRYGIFSSNNTNTIYKWCDEISKIPIVASKLQRLSQDVSELDGLRWLARPQDFMTEWNALSSNIGQVLPGDIHEVAIVYEKQGYRIIKPQEMAKYFKLVAIDRGKAINLKPAGDNQSGSPDDNSNLEVVLEPKV